MEIYVFIYIYIYIIEGMIWWELNERMDYEGEKGKFTRNVRREEQLQVIDREM